jgi:hypothetical protein
MRIIVIFQKQSGGIPDPLYLLTDLFKKNRNAIQKKLADRRDASIQYFSKTAPEGRVTKLLVSKSCF